MRSTIPLALAALLAAAPIAAQAMPDGWMMRLDRSSAGADMASFRTMSPGWHVTTGRAGAGIFWQPAMTAAGEYRLESTMHLMEPAQHPEAYGVLVGGSDLEAESQSYLYFLVRQNGEYLIKRRNGAGTDNVVGWTAHEAIPSAAPSGPTRYDLAIDVGAETVAFIVNGATVHSMPRREVETDGLVGVRINHMLDLHVERLALRD